MSEAPVSENRLRTWTIRLAVATLGLIVLWVLCVNTIRQDPCGLCFFGAALLAIPALVVGAIALTEAQSPLLLVSVAFAAFVLLWVIGLFSRFSPAVGIIKFLAGS